MIAVFEISIFLVMIVFMYSQVLRPLWNNTQIFPIFGKKFSLESDLQRVNDLQETQAMENTINEKLSKLEEIKPKTKTNNNRKGTK